MLISCPSQTDLNVFVGKKSSKGQNGGKMTKKKAIANLQMVFQIRNNGKTGSTQRGKAFIKKMSHFLISKIKKQPP